VAAIGAGPEPLPAKKIAGAIGRSIRAENGVAAAVASIESVHNNFTG